MKYIEDALTTWEENRSFFLETGIRDNFNIPKFHSLLHYIDSIHLFGTTDNYNTEMFERLHMDFAKHGWRASNKRDEFPQMISWLSRQEKIDSFESYLSSSKTEDLFNNDEPNDDEPNDEPVAGSVYLAKFPNYPNKSISNISRSHHAPAFEHHLKEYLNTFLNSTHRTSNQRANLFPLPFNRLNVYNQFKFSPFGLQDEEEERDVVKAIPISRHLPSGRFDTVIVLKTDNAESTGLAGMFHIMLMLPVILTWSCHLGTQVGRVRVIFCLPQKVDFGLGLKDAPASWPKVPLVYVEWYSKHHSGPDRRDSDHGASGMYTIKPTWNSVGAPLGAVVPLSQIRQSCMLIPKNKDSSTERDWTSANVLDKCSSFVINNWQHKYAYQTIW